MLFSGAFDELKAEKKFSVFLFKKKIHNYNENSVIIRISCYVNKMLIIFPFIKERGFCMQDELFEIIMKLKGISCVLSREAMCNSDSYFEWNEEEKMLLNTTFSK